jgi:hypothetical protein
MVFERLPERPKSKPPERGEVVQEQSAGAGQVHLVWLPMAGEVERARREVGSPEGAADRRIDLRPAVGLGNLGRFLSRRGWQEAGETPGEEGLARARRPDQEDGVIAGGSDFESTLGGLLALDVGEVRGLVAIGGRKLLCPTSTTSVQRRQLKLCILLLPAVGAGGLWETRSVFQGVWEGAGWGVGAAAFHTPAALRPG